MTVWVEGSVVLTAWVVLTGRVLLMLFEQVASDSVYSSPTRTVAGLSPGTVMVGCVVVPTEIPRELPVPKRSLPVTSMITR